MQDQTNVFSFIPYEYLEKDRILNSENSDLQVLDGAVYTDGKFYIKQDAIRNITETTVKDLHGNIKSLSPDNYIKCNDPLILSFKTNKNAFAYMVDLEGCLKIIKRMRPKNFKNGKSNARESIISYFQNLEEKKRIFDSKTPKKIQLELERYECKEFLEALEISIDMISVCKKRGVSTEYDDTVEVLKRVQKKLEEM